MKGFIVIYVLTLISALRKDKKDKLLSSKRFRLAEGEEITDEYTISEVC